MLSSGATGLATIRALARARIEVHAIVFDKADPIRYSRHAHKIPFYGRARDTAGLLELIRTVALRLGGRPVVMPTSDGHALMLAQHAEGVLPVCRIWTTRFADLMALVRKDRLYALARGADLDIVPSIWNASFEQVAAWSVDNPAPYLLKPVYVGAKGCALRGKNRVAPDRQALLRDLGHYGTGDLIVQRMLSGGDGEIYDVYGLCDVAGRVVTMASHRRIRQYGPNLGVTSFGAIPSGLGVVDQRLFEDTRRLLAETRFHGIFGIEWLRDRASNRFYIIDFNARPFLSIGHLRDCGLNLPALAYRELLGDDLSEVELLPKLRPRLWVNLLADMHTHAAGTSAQHLPHAQWLLSVATADSHAYMDWRDPGPGIRQAVEICQACAAHLRVVARAFFARRRLASGLNQFD